mmetsp:Transcript_31362/g.41689  ORF Transcript_31362/g.41689 Transcript_31362/m.41689 type:complete len:568 (+) Transcript_31362:2-1705(+)
MQQKQWNAKNSQYKMSRIRIGIERRRKRKRIFAHHIPNSSIFILVLMYSLLLLPSFIITTVHATISIHAPPPLPNEESSSSSTMKKYESQPALFGELLLPGSTYSAHVQMISNDVYLCNGAAANNKNKKSKNNQQQQQQQQQEEDIILPKDGIPIALLAKRGKCSFEAKAKSAMSYEPPFFPLRGRTNYTSTENNWNRIVQFVIVYDDYAHSTLVPMSSSDSDDGDSGGILVRMLFVSLDTGLDLVKAIQTQNNTTKKSGGPSLTIDAKPPYYSPSLYAYNDNTAEEWTLVTLAGFFVALACFGCIVISIQSGYIIREGNVIVIGRRHHHHHPFFGGGGGGGFWGDLENHGMLPSSSSSRPPPVLLTKDQVLNLPEIEYGGISFGEKKKEGGSSTQQGIKKRTSQKEEYDSKNQHDDTSVVIPLHHHHHHHSITSSTRTNYQSISSSSPNDASAAIQQQQQYSNNTNNTWDTSCSICLEEYTNGEKLRVLPCSHVFHTSCIVPWLTTRYPNCPLCKAEVIVVADQEEEVVVEDEWQQHRADIPVQDHRSNSSSSSSSSSEWLLAEEG